MTTTQSAPRPPFTHRTIVKVLAVVLCSLFILTSLFSIVSVVLLAQFGFYTGTFDQTQEEIYLHFGKDRAEQTLYNSYYSVMDSDQLSPEKMREYDARLTHNLLEYYGQKNVFQIDSLHGRKRRRRHGLVIGKKAKLCRRIVAAKSLENRMIDGQRLV